MYWIGLARCRKWAKARRFHPRREQGASCERTNGPGGGGGGGRRTGERPVGDRNVEAYLPGEGAAEELGPLGVFVRGFFGSDLRRKQSPETPNVG